MNWFGEKRLEAYDENLKYTYFEKKSGGNTTLDVYLL